MTSLKRQARRMVTLIGRTPRWVVATGRGTMTAVSRVTAVMLTIAGLMMAVVALPGIGEGAASAAGGPFSATGSLTDVGAGDANATQQVDTGLGYVGGAKEDTVCPDAPQVPVHSNPPKDQITNAWAASSSPYLFLAWQRASAAGDTAIEFELNQLGSPICNGVQTPRTPGDILITWQFTGNAVSQGIVGYVWNGTSWGPQISLASAIDSQGISADGTFADAVFNLQSLFPLLGITSSTCVTYQTGFAKSRSGNGNNGTGFTSELKAVLPSIPLGTTSCQAKVSVAKTGPATGLAGGQGTYHLVATNSGNGVAKAVTITDTLPTGESFVSSNPFTCTAAGQVVSCRVGDLAANGGIATVNVVVSYAANTPANTNLKDCATVSGQTTPSCVTTNIPGRPSVVVVKSGPAAGTAGGQGTYQLVATNSGTSLAPGVIISDTLPTGETFVSSNPVTCTATGQVVTCPVGDLAANGGTATVNVVVSYGAATAGSSLTDCATVPNQTIASCVTTNIPTGPSVSVAKSGPATGAAGGTGTYALVVTNSGGTAATHATFTDTLPTGETFVTPLPAGCTSGGTAVTGISPSPAAASITCDVGTLAANGGTATVDVTVNYGNATTGQTLVDCATVVGQATPSCATTAIPTAASVSVAKSGPATGAAGGTGTYQLVVTNSGGTAATHATFTDTLPAGEGFAPPLPKGCILGGTAVTGTSPSPAGATITCDVGTVPPNGGTATVDVDVIYGNATAGQTLVDCATVAGQAKPSCATTQIAAAAIAPSNPPTQNLVGHIYLCLAGTPTTLEQTGGSLAATGPSTIAATPNPIDQTVDAGTYTVDATAPAGTLFVSCGASGVDIANPPSSADIAGLVVPVGGTGEAIFYVQHTNAPGHSVSLSVTKTNDANGSGTYAPTETASGPGENVPFRVVVTNTSTVLVTITNLADSWAGQAPFSPSCATALAHTTLNAGQSATCDFTVQGYAPAAGKSRTDTVEVTACDSVDPSSCVTTPATSTVETPAATPRHVATASTPSSPTVAAKRAPASRPSVLAFTGVPARLGLLLELGLGLMLMGTFMLWWTRPRRLSKH